MIEIINKKLAFIMQYICSFICILLMISVSFSCNIFAVLVISASHTMLIWSYMILHNIKNNIIWFFHHMFKWCSIVEYWHLAAYTTNICIESFKKFNLKFSSSFELMQAFKNKYKASGAWKLFVGKIIFSMERALSKSSFMAEKDFCKKSNVAYDKELFYEFSMKTESLAWP